MGCFYFNNVASAIQTSQILLFLVNAHDYISCQIINDCRCIVSDIQCLACYVIVSSKVGIGRCDSYQFAECSFNTDIPFHLE